MAQTRPKWIESVSAFFAGVCLVVALIFAALSIQERISGAGVRNFITLLMAVILVGSSTGHFVGRALVDQPRRLIDFVAGIFATLFIALVYMTFFVISDVKLAVVGPTFASAFLLLHVSKLMDNEGELTAYVRLFTELVSPATIGIIAVLKYVLPVTSRVVSAFI